jgi:hypothetical protein
VPRKFGTKFARAYSKMDSGMAGSDRTDAIFITETAGDGELGGSMGLEIAAESTLATTDLCARRCHGRDQRRWV